MARKFAVFDIDGTLIRWQLYHAIADALVRRGYISPDAYSAIRDARMEWKRRAHPEAFKTYEQQLVELYQKAIGQLSVESFHEAADAVFDEYKDQVYIYTRDLIMSLKKDGYLLFAISGSQSEIVEKIGRYYNFDDFAGTSYLQQDGKFTGGVKAALGAKHKVLAGFIAKHKADIAGSIAVGDSAGDISMLEAVQTPIAFNPERKLYDYAARKSWKIVIERKNMVYELEGHDGKYQLVKTNS